MPDKPPTDRHKQVSSLLADDTSLTAEEKLRLARTLAGPLPQHKKPLQQKPDWLQGRFEQHQAVYHRHQQHRNQRVYLICIVGGWLVLVGLTLLLIHLFVGSLF